MAVEYKGYVSKSAYVRARAAAGVSLEVLAREPGLSNVVSAIVHHMKRGRHPGEFPNIEAVAARRGVTMKVMKAQLLHILENEGRVFIDNLLDDGKTTRPPNKRSK